MLKNALASETEKLLACVHCGLCLPVCPTYRQLGNENDSPRGRLYLMRAVAEGKLNVSDTYYKHIDRCLGCRACETICPSGVRFGLLLETARGEIVADALSSLKLSTRIKQWFTGLVLNQIFTRKAWLAVAWAMAQWLQNSGVLKLILTTRLFSFAPKLEFSIALLQQAQSQLPLARRLFTQPDTHSTVSAAITGSGKVAPFLGCIMEGMFRETNIATERVLQINGYGVNQVADQVCCGALHAHSGFHQTAIALAKANIDAFTAGDEEDQTPIIVNAAGCGAMLKEYGELLREDKDYAARAVAFSARVKDVSEFLAAKAIIPGTPLQLKLTYDAPCHLYHGQAVREQPLQLIKSIPQLEFIPLTGAEQCCGSAGIYNITHADMAGQLLKEKLEYIKQTRARVLVTGNPGCAMHIGAGAELAGIPLVVLHPIELLALSYHC